MKILAFSDIHRDASACHLIVEAAAQADLVIGAGDFASCHDGLAEVMQLLAPLGDKALLVPGNNETANALRAATDLTVLHGEVAVRGGLTIAGIGAAIPPLPPLPWRSYDLTEEQAGALLAPITKADIFISHSPPLGVVDRHAQAGSIGSATVLQTIKRLQPALVFCGHIHDCWGDEALVGTSRVCNLGPSINWYSL